MRGLLILTPIVLVGGIAIHQAVSGPDIRMDKVEQISKHHVPTLAAAPAVPTVPVVPAIPAVSAVPAVHAVPAVPNLEGLSRLATLSEDVEIRIPREAIERASRLANDFRLRAEAHADVEVTLNEVMRMLDEHLSGFDGATVESLEDLGLSETFFADLAASIEASVSVEMDDGNRVAVRVPKRRRQ
jgi:hypothetical protein